MAGQEEGQRCKKEERLLLAAALDSGRPECLAVPKLPIGGELVWLQGIQMERTRDNSSQMGPSPIDISHMCMYSLPYA